MNSKKIPQTQTGPRANPCEGEEGVSRQAGLPAGKKTRLGARAGRGVAGIHLGVTQEQFRISSLEVHPPVFRHSVITPLRNSASGQAAHFSDLAGSSKCINYSNVIGNTLFCDNRFAQARNRNIEMLRNELRNIVSATSAQIAPPTNRDNIQRLCVIPVIVVSGWLPAVNTYKFFGWLQFPFSPRLSNSRSDLDPCITNSTRALIGAVACDLDATPWYLCAAKRASFAFSKKSLIFVFPLTMKTNIAFCAMNAATLRTFMLFIRRHCYGPPSAHPNQCLASVLRNEQRQPSSFRLTDISQQELHGHANSRRAAELLQAPWQAM